ncbi:hypothetical protein ILYODFUR_026422 [Ilyodon furcidens]|uniref:Uncharacterized protein n=1 Tax=Ilyodon furcidens TaxID=33524 RepID=A0ABV0V7Y6_9TELE
MVVGARRADLSISGPGKQPPGILMICPGFSDVWEWLDLLRRRQLPAGPVGSSLQLLGASALWMLGGSPGTLSCSSLGEELLLFSYDGSPGVPVLWGAFGCLWLRSPPYLSQV